MRRIRRMIGRRRRRNINISRRTWIIIIQKRIRVRRTRRHIQNKKPEETEGEEEEQ